MKQIYKKMQFEANFERHDDPEFYRSKNIDYLMKNKIAIFRQVIVQFAMLAVNPWSIISYKSFI